MKKRSVTANKKHKDTVFRMLFKDKENLLSLYNALNGTDYTDVESLEIRTLENAIFMGFKNDQAFIFHDELSLYEHQSTKNPNMPLRLLFYVSDILHALINDKKIYSSIRVTIPTPRFVVLYNGVQEEEEQLTYKLSDLYKKPTDTPELELTVRVYNINEGQNKAIVSSCKVLGEYVRFVSVVRSFAKEYSREEAVAQAVNYCIEHNILGEFLIRNRAEVVKMSIYEYDEEAVYAMWAEEFEAKGFEKGKCAMLAELVRDGYIAEEDAAERLGMTLEEFREKQQAHFVSV